MADLPFLGCKISLISKCDIRYEGILFCVDPKESTISLSKVRSYGTETRGDPANFVPPKNDVYDVIIFRASDVKDLRVDAPEPPGLSDPAIISARQSSNSTFDANPNGSLPTSSGPSHQQSQQGHHHQQKPLLPFLPTGSSKDQQQSQQSQPVVNYSSAVSSNAQRRTRPDDRKSDHDMNNRKSEVSSGRDGHRRGVDGGDRRSDKRDNDRRDDRRGRVSSDRRDYHNHHQQQHHDGGRRNDNRPQPRMNRSGYDRNHVNSNSRYNNSASNRRGPPNHRDDDSKGPMNRRRGGPMQGSRRGRSGDRTGAPRGARKSAPLKFEGDYDFDEANKLFMEMDSKFKNMKVKDDHKDENGESSGDRANSKSPTGQSESGSGYDSEDQNHKDGDSKEGGFGGSVSGEYYDKSKSFFDNISCEANERSQGKIGKPDWRKERQTNAETFGISANYRRGGYRGRSYGANGYHRR